MSVIYYLHGDQLLLRKRPTLIRDPRTPAQRQWAAAQAAARRTGAVDPRRVRR